MVVWRLRGWLRLFHPSNQVAAKTIFLQSLIVFNDYAFIVQYCSNIHSTLLALFDMLPTYDRPFLHVCILQENLLFSTLILGSVFSDYDQTRYRFGRRPTDSLSEEQINLF